MHDRIRELLLQLGICPKVNGYMHIAYGLELILQKPVFLDNISHRLYPAIAKRFESTPSRVERSIRYAIEMMFNRCDFEKITDILILPPMINSGKYTNSEFLAVCAMKLQPEVF